MGYRQKQFKANKEDTLLKDAYCEGRNRYFSKIKKAKQDNWNSFLEKGDAKSVFKAMAYTRDIKAQKIPSINSNSGTLVNSFERKCDAFRSTLFPSPPICDNPCWDGYEQNNWTWPVFSKEELEQACSADIKGKVPGPDELTQEIITRAYRAIPDCCEVRSLQRLIGRRFTDDYQ